MTPYKITGRISADEVPDWARREPKWAELVEAVLSLEPGEVLRVEFQGAHEVQEARRARNAVRDAANLKAGTAVVRTRLVEENDELATLYLIRLYETETEE